MHSEACEQGAPMDFFPHWFIRHWFPEAHWVLAEQEVKQEVVPLHR